MALEIRVLRAGDEHLLDNVAEGVFDGPIDAALRSEFLRDPRHHLCVGIEDGIVVGFASAVHYVHPDKPLGSTKSGSRRRTRAGVSRKQLCPLCSRLGDKTAAPKRGC
jgi:hypothetical protein